jgi:glucan 1,3-beta-glucosidase
MKDNVNNYWGAAPDKGSLTGPVLGPLNATTLHDMHPGRQKMARDNSDSYWLSTLGKAGSVSPGSGHSMHSDCDSIADLGDC